MFLCSCVPSVASGKAERLCLKKFLCLFDGAKVRRFPHSHNPLDMSFYIPHLWYLLRHEDLKLFYTLKNLRVNPDFR